MCPKSEKDLFGNEIIGFNSGEEGAALKDIWSVLLLPTSKPFISNNYFMEPKGSLNRINREVCQEVDEKIQEIVSQYDLDHIFALDMELNWLIRKFASFIYDEKIYLSAEIKDSIIPTLHTKFDKINEIIDFQLLLAEISEAKSIFHKSGQKELVVKRNMTMLAMLQKSAEKKIENNPFPSPIEKAESYLNSYLISNTKYCHNESLVYLLCKQRKNPTVLKETISRLERYAVKTRELSLVDNDPFISIPQSTALRLGDWKYLRAVNFSLDQLGDRFETYFSRPFSIFRADLGIMYRWEELKDAVEALQNIFEKLSQSSDELLSRTGHKISKPRFTSAIASLWVFAYYRINGKFGKKNIVNSAIDYLLSNQKFYLFDSTIEPFDFCKTITVAAMAVHAIAMAKLPDSQKFLTKVKDWLLEKQTKYGYWYQPGENPDYTTVFVLDAIELAGGGHKVTFDISVPKKETNEIGTKNVPVKNQIIQISPERIDINIQGQSISDLLKPILSKKMETIDESPSNVKDSDKKLLEDPINKMIIQIYQAVNTVRSGNGDSELLPFHSMPAQKQIAYYLYKYGLTETTLTKQAISKRINKLKSANLIKHDDDCHDKAALYDPSDLSDMEDKIREKF